jgi:hypothetical protein
MSDNIDQRLQGLTETVASLAAMQRDTMASIQELLKTIAADAENIRALPRIAEAHEHRITDLEGGVQLRMWNL